MDALETIAARRSVRKFDPQFRIPEAQFQRILEAGALAPSALNIQHWRFVAVRQAALREQICALAHGQMQVVQASHLVAVCADTRAWEKRPERYVAVYPPQAQSAKLAMIEGYRRLPERAWRDEAVRSGSFAAQNMMLAAKALGYDSVPMMGMDVEAVSKLLRLPQDVVLVVLLAIGKALPNAVDTPRGLLPLNDILFEDHF